MHCGFRHIDGRNAVLVAQLRRAKLVFLHDDDVVDTQRAATEESGQQRLADLAAPEDRQPASHA